MSQTEFFVKLQEIDDIFTSEVAEKGRLQRRVKELETEVEYLTKRVRELEKNVWSRIFKKEASES